MSGLDSAKLVWPVRVDGKPGRGGSTITQEFKPGRHPGVDIAVPGAYHNAEADVVAVAHARVARAVRGARGWYVLLDHGDWASSYLHMTSVSVKAGDTVEPGDKLGRMGADPLDGEHIVHLHFQLAPFGAVVDPATFLEGA